MPRRIREGDGEYFAGKKVPSAKESPSKIPEQRIERGYTLSEWQNILTVLRRIQDVLTGQSRHWKISDNKLYTLTEITARFISGMDTETRWLIVKFLQGKGILGKPVSKEPEPQDTITKPSMITVYPFRPAEIRTKIAPLVARAAEAIKKLSKASGGKKETRELVRTILERPVRQEQEKCVLDILGNGELSAEKTYELAQKGPNKIFSSRSALKNTIQRLLQRGKIGSEHRVKVGSGGHGGSRTYAVYFLKNS